MAIDRTALIIDYLKKIKSANKELTKKEIFKDLLNRLYTGDKEIEKIIDAISIGAETAIVNIPRKEKIHRGSADTLYNNIIIEFENDLRVSLEHAKEQLAGYMLGRFKSGEGYNYTLIASDFITWKVLAPDISCIDKLDTLQEDELILNVVETASFVLTENNTDDFYYWIDRFLFKEEKQRATLKKIEEAFGYQSNVFIESLRELSKHFDEAKKYSEVQVSYEQWRKFLSFAYGTFDASDKNFLIHTYLSVFSKILAYTVVSNDDFIDDDEMKGILNGNIFNKYNIRNFVDNDFFHWVGTERSLRSLKKVFRLISQEISTFDFTYVEEDILKGVYQELIDLDTRHSLGEYYTPDWLCERVVNEYSFKKQDKILDPACGSGSFLRAAIHRLRTQYPDITAEEINKNIYGIDIHPLSVQIAKTTLLLALGKEIANSKRPVFLNIILANTLNAPEGVETLFGGNFTMQIDKEKHLINTQILDDVNFFDDAIDICEKIAEQSLHKEPESIEAFEAILVKNKKSGGLNQQIIDDFYKVYLALKKVKERGRDSIWKFIVQNLYKPYFLSKRFDYVIGNPPWFTYSSIKNEEYQKTLNELAIKYKVKPAKVSNFPHLEIAAIFLAYCSSYFLKENGKLAFVLPRSFFSADHHDNTRAGKASGFKLTNIWDLNDVYPLFRIPSCVLFVEKTSGKKEMPASGVPGLFLKGKLPSHNCNFNEATTKLTETEVKYYYGKLGKSTAFVTKKTRANTQVNPYAKHFKQGATIVPRVFYFVELDQDIPPDFNDRIVNVKTPESIKKDAKKPWNAFSFSGQINSRFLFITAISKNILPFAMLNPVLVTLPVKIQEESKKVSLLTSVELLREGYLDASKWFKNVENIWDINKTEKSKNMTSNDRVDFQRGLTEQNLNCPYLVLYNSSAKDANATIVKREELDLEFFVESATYVFYTDNLFEAYYLSAILNSKAPNELMKDFQARGSFGARHVHKKILDVFFPQFDEKNELHVQLSEISKRAHEKTSLFLKEKVGIIDLPPTKLGRLRTEIKQHLAKEMKEIDKIVKKVVG